ncbi:MAG: tetratricopeptide repeat protein, partial [Thermodesulfobacteriota bacterium]
GLVPVRMLSGWGVGETRGRMAAPWIAVVLLASMWATWTWLRLDAWRDPLTLWTDVLEKQPESARVHGNLGKEYHIRGQLAEARHHLTRAAALDPRDPKPLANLARVEADGGDFLKARAILQELERGGLRDHIIYSDLGWVHYRLGNLREAAHAYELALGYEPRLSNVNYRLAEIYARLGDRARAGAFARQELVLNPQHPEARRLLTALGEN